MSPAIVLIWLAIAYAVYDLFRRPAHRTPGRIWLVSGVACLTAAGTVSHSRAAVSAAVPHLELVLINGFVLAGVACLQAMLLHWTRGPHVTWAALWARHGPIAAVIALMVVLAVVAPGALDRANPQAVWFFLLRAGVVSWVAVDVARMSWRYTHRVTDRPAAVAGLVLLCAAGWLTAGYFASTVLDAVVPGPPHPVLAAAKIAAMALFAAAVAVPALSDVAGRARRVVDAWHCHQLRPLWLAIVDTMPAVALAPPRPSPADTLTLLAASDDWVLNRRIIEIRDGYLELQPWLDCRVDRLAQHYVRMSRLTGLRARATVEAAVIAAALRSRARGDDPTGTGQVQPGADDLSGELRWLVRVSRALRSRVVRQVLDDLEERERADLTWVDQQLTQLGLPTRR